MKKISYLLKQTTFQRDHFGYLPLKALGKEKSIWRGLFQSRFRQSKSLGEYFA